MLLHLEELAVIHYALNDVLDVIGKVGGIGNERIESRVLAIGGIIASPSGRIVAVVRRQIAEQLANHAQAFGVVMRQEMRHAAGGVVRSRAAERFLGDILVGHGLDHVRSGDEHVAGVLHHEDEVGEGGGINRTAGARAHDGGDLRDHAAR